VTHEISERNLPGIGRSYTLEARDGTEVLAVLHNSGRRDVYLSPPGSEERTCLVLDDDEARRLGAVLSGVYFKPEAVARVESLIGGLLIEWVTVGARAPSVDRSIAELEIRRHTRMTVVAVVHADGSSVVAPEPAQVIRAGDQLVVIGRPEDLPGFRTLVLG
jgi:K+:H+ antiporter subunit KhtT